MKEIRKKVGFIQLVLVICFINNALCHYVPLNDNNTESIGHHRSRRDVEQDQKICDALEKVDDVGSIVSMIPLIGPIFDTAVTVAKFGLKSKFIETGCDSLPFEDIKKKMDERFDKLDEKVERNFIAINQLYTEIHRLFDEVTDSIRDARIHPVLSEMKMFIEGFSMYQSKIDGYFEDGNYYEIDEILDDLKDAVKPTGGSLSTPVNNIINQNFAIPEDGDDKSGILALNTLYYGVETYASVLSFLLEKHNILADYYYGNGDTVNYNKKVRTMKVIFSDLKGLISKNIETSTYMNNKFGGKGFSQKSLFDRFFNIAQLAIRSIKVQRRDSDKPLIDSVHEKIKLITKTNNAVKEMVLPIIKEMPSLGKYLVHQKNPGGRLRIIYLLCENVERVLVKYAIQYRRKGSYSLISKWSKEYILGETKYASIKFPKATPGTTRLVFRKLSSKDQPQLVGIIDDPSQTSFMDIHRDLYDIGQFWTSENQTEIRTITSRLIDNGANVNAIFDNGKSPLHAAVEGNNVDAATILLQNRNITVNIQDENGYTPLHTAVEFGHENFCELLLRKGADINMKTYGEGLTPLHMAVLGEQTEIVKLLMKSSGINVNLGDTKGDTPLHYAVNNSQSVVKILVGNGNVNVNAKNNAGLTPLHYAVSNKLLPVVSALLTKKKIRVNVLSKSKLSPLHQAATDNSYNIAELLLSNKNVNVDMEGAEGLRPIHFATMRGHKNFVELLVRKNAQLNVNSSTGWTPLHFAVTLRKTDMISLLLSFRSKGLDVNSKTDEGYTPLHMAVGSLQYDVIEDLIKEGADLEAVTKDGLTPLHIAAMHNDVKVIDILLNKGANTQAKTPEGKLFWELAVEKGNLEVVKHIVPKNLTLAEQKVLLNTATKPPNTDVLKYIIEERKYECEWRDMQSMLYASIENNSTENSKYIIDLIIKTEGKYYLQYLTKHFVAAARAENLHIVKYLDLNQKKRHYHAEYESLVNFVEEYVDKNGVKRRRTALHEALYARNSPIIEHLMRCLPKLYIQDEQGKDAVFVAKELGLMDVYGMFKADSTCSNVRLGKTEIEIEFINERCYDFWKNIFSYSLNIAITHDNNIAEDLISKGANINARDDNGNTPLHLAFAHKKFPLAKHIMTKNPDVRIKNNNNQKPIDIARENGAPNEIISNLITMENKLNRKDGFPM